MGIEDEPVQLTEAEFAALKAAIRAQHEAWAKAHPRHVAMRAFCICGYPSIPGVADAVPACSALRKLTGGA